jgi:hypothetical protein
MIDHQHIEDEEDARERTFEGLPEEADLGTDHPANDPLDEHAHAEGEGPAAVSSDPEGDGQAAPPRTTRAIPNAAPKRLQDDEASGKIDLREVKEKVKGKVRQGHGAPRSPEERLKAGVPYSELFFEMAWRGYMLIIEYKYVPVLPVYHSAGI